MKKLFNLFVVGAFLVFAWRFIGDVVVECEFNYVETRARQGDVNEQLRLAQLYEQGMFAEQNEKEALYWYTKAAGNRSRVALILLCNNYNIGCKEERNASQN